ncbi:zinc-binding dehydrogenase [Streptomyces sp. WM4235]|uniref:zinc-binding dehydrogenase n=1 Tax=Streptomyces sp. WM4235 TaxID=1415551 RepID=UPI0006AE21FC|nr:zinc-binding dehydrogenase [Streptomyces sp. WM4235]
MEAVLVDPTKKGAEKFRLGTVPDPRPVEGAVLVEVKAVALSAWEKEFAQDDDPRSLTRRTRKKNVNLGLEFSGIVRSDGRRFKKGQRVMGGPHLTKDEKSLAQYVSVCEEYLAELPDALDYARAAALPIGAETALTSLDRASVHSGDHVLVVGASGGVGVYAVQIAAARGATVTAVGGRRSAARLKDIGSTTSHYYGDKSFEDLAGPFDAVLDLSGTLRFSQVRKKLSRRGTFVNVNPQKDITGMITSRFSRKKTPFIFIPRSSAPMQTRILDLVTQGKIQPIVEANYDISQFRTAFSDLIHNDRFGKIVISH